MSMKFFLFCALLVLSVVLAHTFRVNNDYWGQICEFKEQLVQQQINSETKLRLAQDEIDRLKKELDRAHINYSVLKDFETKDTLLAFLLEDKTNEMVYVKKKFDCDDFVFTLISNAAKKGYRIYPQCIVGYLNPHMLAMAIVVEDEWDGEPQRNVVYFIEPQTDEFWRSYALD